MQREAWPQAHSGDLSSTKSMTDAAPVRHSRRTPRLTGIVDTLRGEGVGWVVRRFRYRTPATASGRAIHRLVRRGLGLLLAPVRCRADVESLRSEDTLYAFYDLQVAPITYDACWFAAAADLARRRHGLGRVHFVIVPGVVNGLREERRAYDAVVDTHARWWRLHNIVVPILSLVPACAGYTLLPSREAVWPLRAAAGERVYPDHYEAGFPVAHHPSELLKGSLAAGSVGVLRASTQGLRYVQAWLAERLQDRRLVTITLREYGFMTARNSNLDAWVAFARRLDPRKYLVTFVLDTERTLESGPSRFEGFEVFREVSWNVGLRMALYESSYLNMGVNNGPLFMAALNDRTRLLVFKVITPSVPQTTEEFMERLGFPIGGQLPFATPLQRLVWEDDRLEVIQREFEAMVEKIEANFSLRWPAS